MSDESPLIVPVDLKALLVNRYVRAQNFQRWQMNYANLPLYVSPEPLPFAGSDPDWGTDPANDGVWLHFRLPRALRHGVHDTVTAQTTWPLVPNRWAVIRFSGPLDARVASGWVIESDYLSPTDGSSAFIDPSSTSLQVTKIGRMLPLPWSETSTTPMFLTGVAPGNVNFASYQPYVENVFSMHDDVSGVAEGEILSYLVVGWYSDPTQDILARWEAKGDFLAYLARLGWTVSEPSSTATTSVYEGIVYGLTWQTTGLPPSNKPSTSDTLLAVASTSIDALTAMVAKEAGPGSSIDPELLQAFQYDLVRLLDQPNGQILVDRAVYEAWFGAFPGGYGWEIVPADHPPPGAPKEPPPAPDWLYPLNRDQIAYDELVLQRDAAQYHLYQVWWKQGRAPCTIPYPTGVSSAQFEAAFDPSDPTSLVSRVHDLMVAVDLARKKIPWGDTQEALEQSIADFAKSHDLSPLLQLKRADRRNHHGANDPVVCIHGTNAQSIEEEPLLLRCRFPDQTVTGFVYEGSPITSADMGSGIPVIDTTNLPAVTPALVTELFFVDPTDATLVAQDALDTTDPTVIASVAAVMAAHDADLGRPPAIMSSWAQPWAPLFLMWQATFYPITFGTNAAPSFTFDGLRYTWTGDGAETSADHVRQIAGRVFLTPQSSFNFKARMDQYLLTYPDADLRAVEDFITQTFHWDFLSQALSGFDAQLVLQDTRSLVAPDDQQIYFPPDQTLAGLVGPGATRMPMPGVPQASFGAWPPSGFQELRSGQFYFQKVMVVDRFGQSLEIVTTQTADRFAPIVGEGLVPQQTVLPLAPQKWVELTPRVLQPAQLRMELVSATDDRAILGMDPGVNPVCAWVLPNHLDHSLACYGPTGEAVGDAYIVMSTAGTLEVGWFPSPFSGYTTLASLAPDLPHLAEFLLGVQAAGPAAFEAMLRVIDETLWSIDPLGDRADAYLSVLIGRPLALVRARLAYALAGPAVSDPSWRFTFAREPPETPSYVFPVRLGDLPLRSDGLIGYFRGSDYSALNAVYLPQGVTSPYVKPIGPGNFIDLRFDVASLAYVTMLVDPRAGVHAVTDLLPVAELVVPQQFVAPALSKMDVSFNVGPLLSDRIDEVGEVPTIAMPLPAEQNGAWSWVQADSATPVRYGVVATDQAAKLSNVAPALRAGWLELSATLSGALGATRKPPEK